MKAIFLDYLLEDDPVWYFMGTESCSLKNYWGERGYISVFKPLRDWMYSCGMVYLGLPFIRGIHVAVMTGISIFLYRIYNDIFKINSTLSIAACILPNILPTLKGIPAGLNESYAMWGLLPMLMSIWLNYLANLESRLNAHRLIFYSLLCYVVGLHMNPSANFLIPVVLFSLVAFSKKSVQQTFFTLLPFLIIAFIQVLLQRKFTHIQPTDLPPDVILWRFKEFLKQGIILPKIPVFKTAFLLLLIVFGITGILQKRFHEFNLKSEIPLLKSIKSQYVMIAWVFLWLFGNGVVYIAMTPTFRLYDYAYVFNFGNVLLQLFGIKFILWEIIKSIKLSKYFNSLWMGALLVIFLFTGIQRLIKYSSKEKTILLFRKLENENKWPENSQLILLTEKDNSFNCMGMDSGKARYATKRHDLAALTGKEEFPANVFMPMKGWGCSFQGLHPDKPLFIYDLKGTEIKRVSFLLNTEKNNRDAESKFRWQLYYTKDNGQIVKIAESNIYQYQEILNAAIKYAGRPVNESEIAFFLGELDDQIILNNSQKDLYRSHSMDDVAIGEILSLKGYYVSDTDNIKILNLVLEVRKRVPEDLRFEVDINERNKRIPILNLAETGDAILLPLKLEAGDKNLAKLTFRNTGNWPFQIIPVTSKGLKESLIIDLTTDDN